MRKHGILFKITKNKITKALLVNTKNANTFTGRQGFQGLKELSKSLSKHLTLKLAQAPKGIREAAIETTC